MDYRTQQIEIALERIKLILVPVPSAAELIVADAARLKNWSIVSSSEFADRGHTIIFRDSELIAVDHAGNQIIELRTVLSDLDGSIPDRYGSFLYRVTQAFVAFRIIGKSPVSAFGHVLTAFPEPDATVILDKIMEIEGTDI